MIIIWNLDRSSFRSRPRYNDGEIRTVGFILLTCFAIISSLGMSGSVCKSLRLFISEIFCLIKFTVHMWSYGLFLSDFYVKSLIYRLPWQCLPVPLVGGDYYNLDKLYSEDKWVYSVPENSSYARSIVGSL